MIPIIDKGFKGFNTFKLLSSFLTYIGGWPASAFYKKNSHAQRYGTFLETVFKTCQLMKQNGVEWGSITNK
jgi:hypothetical protein